MEEARKPNIFSCLTVAILLSAGIFYLLIGINTGNWAWFLGSKNLDKPARIIINDFGEKQILTVEDEQFQQLAEAIAESISNLNNTSLIPVGLSDLAIEDYNTKSFVLEIHYATPINFQALYRTGKPTKLLIPIEGRNAADQLFFRGHRDEWWFGGMRMESVEPIHDALVDLGYRQP